jgi:hypothetical protein
MTPKRDYYDVLSTLTPGSEVNVYTRSKTYYDAKFLNFNSRTGVANFQIDQFYKCGGYPITICCSKITAMDLPLSLQEGSDEDE